MKRPVRRGYLVVWPFALAAALAYGIVASALAVPLAHREALSDAIAGAGADCHVDAAAAIAADAAPRIEPRTAADDGASAPGRITRTRDRDAHAGHVGHAATETAEAPSSDGDRRPTPDHFDCCTTRLGTVGTHVLALALVERLEPGARRVRAPRPRMPFRPRPWRVSLGRQPPAPSVGTTLAI